jgi:hypothetical protein
MKHRVPASLALAALQVVASPFLAAQQQQARPIYVVRTMPSKFPADFKERAKDVIENCCGGSVHAALSCPPGQSCEDIFIDGSEHEFVVRLDVTHPDDLRPYGRASYFRGTKDEQRQDQVLDWLRALVKCDDVRHHAGRPKDLAKLSAYCQLCLLFDTQVPDLLPTKKSR